MPLVGSSSIALLKATSASSYLLLENRSNPSSRSCFADRFDGTLEVGADIAGVGVGTATGAGAGDGEAGVGFDWQLSTGNIANAMTMSNADEMIELLIVLPPLDNNRKKLIFFQSRHFFE